LVLGVNAWMQQPVGFEMQDGRVIATDPVAILRQPLWFYMALHSTLACYLSVAFAVAGWYAWQLLRGARDEYNRSALIIAIVVGSVAAVLQPATGDWLAKFVFQTQPVKFAAMEGQFKTQRYAPLRIGGWPDTKAETTRYAIEIPGGLSYLAAHDRAAEVPGLDRVPKSDWPNVEITHLAFQVMVGAGTLLTAVSIWFWIALMSGGRAIAERRMLLSAVVITAPLGFIGLEAGWFVTEVGRQPWIIQHVLRTSDAVTPAAGVPTMFFAFSSLYLLLGTTVVVLLRRIAAAGEEL
jgi:cytochrome d ubiquinol oxidase subunit I